MWMWNKFFSLTTFVVSTLLLNFFTMLFVVATMATIWDKKIVGVTALDESWREEVKYD